jgi:hypothetical protein
MNYISMNKSRFLVLVVVLLSILNLGLIWAVFRMKSKPGPKYQISKRLNFSKEQQDTYEVFIKAHRIKIREQEALLYQKKNNLYALLKGDKPSQLVIDSLITDINRVHSAIENIHLNHFYEIKSICDTPQLQPFNEMIGDLSKYFNGKGHKKQ